VQVSFERYRMICRRNIVVTRNQDQTDRECYGFTQAGNPPAAHVRIVGRAVMAPSAAGELRGRTVCRWPAWHEVPIECR
jgi:hypothetical protein